MKTDPHLRITDLKLVVTHSSERKAFQEQVSELISEGWEPYGEVQSESAVYRITLVKYEVREEVSDFMQQLFLSLMEKIERLEEKL